MLLDVAVPPAEPSAETGVVVRRSIQTIEWIERCIFLLIGTLLFLAAGVLLARSTVYLLAMATAPSDSVLPAGSAFLDIILLVLIPVELAYTVVLSLKGYVLLAEPFLIVGLIAVVRRILVITVGDSQHGPHGVIGPASAPMLQELMVLTGIVAVFVLSIAILRRRAQPEYAQKTRPQSEL